jgi:hypothetical protein
MAISKGDGAIILKTKVDTDGAKAGLSSLKSVIGKAGKAIMVAGAAATVALTKMSVDAYAEFEQMVGGVETLFKSSAGKVLKYANEAYKTTGMSANEYMKNVTSFSASLLQSVGGDTEKAAEIANDALISMSDNANKFGTDQESVLNAFQGFAKGQYMLLDNLKLGYGGTKTEMQRLLKDAQAITGVKYNIDNLADVYTAIGVIQEKLGVAGTTAKEAATTISGSAAMMKASWQNVLTAISGGGDMDAAIENFTDSLATYFENIIPVVEKALEGIGELISKVAPKLIEKVAAALIEAIPQLLNAIYQMIVGLVKGIIDGIKALFSGTSKEVAKEEIKAIDEATKSQNKLTDAVEETADAQEKSLAGFDTLQTISSGSNQSSGEVATGTEEQVPGGIATELTSGTSEAIKSEVDAIVAIGSALLLAIGLIMCFWSGPSLKALGLIAAGSVGLAKAAYDNRGAIKKMINGVVGDITAATSVLLLALGIILCCAGVSIPLGIGLIAASAGILATEEAFSPGRLLGLLRGPIGDIMGIGGALLIVIGILLCCTGAGLGLGIGCILAGVLMVGTYVAANWDAIFGPIKEVIDDIEQWFSDLWEDIKEGWEALVDSISTFWDVLGKTSGMSVLEMWDTKDRAEKILAILERKDGTSKKLAQYLNEHPEAYDDYVYKGVKIPGIPGLANGAVIPGGKPFLAMLGDQPSGHTNIEAPLDTIVEAFNIAQGKQSIQIEFTGNMSQLIRVLNPQIKAENKRASVFVKG